jgi:GTP-binding protein Era
MTPAADLPAGETGLAGIRSGFVALVGRPNVGKSTLANALVGTKVSIVSSKPQTTRHRIAAVVNGDGWQMVLLDIPGFQKPRDLLTERLQQRVLEALGEVDAVLFLLDASAPLGRGDEYIAQTLGHGSAATVVALNKADLVGPALLAEQSARAAELAGIALGDLAGERGFPAAPLAVSALTGTGLADLTRELVELLPEGPTYFPAGVVTDQPEELLMAELIREQALELTEEEVPHALAVQILEAEPRPGKDLLYVRAAIYVERDSQRPILLGQGGTRIKQIGSQARQEIEALLGTQIFLDLGVKVRKKWRRDPAMLERFGL